MNLQSVVESILIISSSFVIGGILLVPIKMMIEKKMSEWLYPRFEWDERHQDDEDDDDFGDHDHDHDEDGNCKH